MCVQLTAPLNGCLQVEGLLDFGDMCVTWGVCEVAVAMLYTMLLVAGDDDEGVESLAAGRCVLVGTE